MRRVGAPARQTTMRLINDILRLLGLGRAPQPPRLAPRLAGRNVTVRKGGKTYRYKSLYEATKALESSKNSMHNAYRRALRKQGIGLCHVRPVRFEVCGAEVEVEGRAL